MDVSLLLLALLGHAVLWVAAGNRIHATAMPHWMTGCLSLLCIACLLLVPAGWAWWSIHAGVGPFAGLRWSDVPLPIVPYLGACWVAAVAAIARWVRRGLWHRPPAVLRWHRTRLVELAQDCTQLAPEEHAHHFLVRLPRNEILKLDVTERAIEVPRLALALDGLSIVHLSDFHFTGRVAKAYFQEVVRRSNQMEPDLVAITGDLVDRSPQIDWIPDTLGRLRARHGVYFVLGNHDLRVDTKRLCRVLEESGLVGLGGRWVQVEIRGQPVVLAGNELPWLVPAADMSGCPARSGDGPLRIVLAHSPDQLDWAQAQDADLLLAGHTHGGQIRLPLIGPILSPTREGVKYASGVFYAPPTIMHVTRGVSGLLPVRLKCPPEMVYLTLHAAQRE
jgi:predicted MPP superfamily phosphohydrolase